MEERVYFGFGLQKYEMGRHGSKQLAWLPEQEVERSCLQPPTYRRDLVSEKTHKA